MTELAGIHIDPAFYKALGGSGDGIFNLRGLRGSDRGARVKLENAADALEIRAKGKRESEQPDRLRVFRPDSATLPALKLPVILMRAEHPAVYWLA